MSNSSKILAPEISFGSSGRKDMIFQLPLTASELAYSKTKLLFSHIMICSSLSHTPYQAKTSQSAGDKWPDVKVGMGFGCPSTEALMFLEIRLVISFGIITNGEAMGRHSPWWRYRLNLLSLAGQGPVRWDTSIVRVHMGSEILARQGVALKRW